MDNNKQSISKQVLPLLRWAGSKKQLLPILKTYWNNGFNRYVEPFAGSARLFFELQPKDAIIGDINKELIATYQEIKLRPHKVIEALQKFKTGKNEYYRIRNMDKDILTTYEKAARFIFLNRFCFNGLFRTNMKGTFNVPYGGLKSGNLPDEMLILQISSLFKKAKLVSGDYEKVLLQTKQGDFIYMDPPYSIASRRTFKEYSAKIFSSEDLDRLRNWICKLENNNIKFLLSYADSEEATTLRRGFTWRTVNVKRNIAGFTGSRKLTKELLITNIM